MSSLAARTREAVRERPFLRDALRAEVVNYTATARYLDVEGETEAIATALGRYAEELHGEPAVGADARVSMESGVGRIDGADPATEPLISVSGTAYARDAGSLTALVVAGDVGPRLAEQVLGRLAIEDFDVDAAAVAGETMVVVVGRRAGVDALRAVEAVIEAS
jgi:hypothetical protein